MDNEPVAHHANEPAAPPTTPDELIHTTRTAWPTVLGVVGIVWAALSVMSRLFTLALAAALKSGFLDDVTDVDSSDMFSAYEIAFSLVDIALAVYLLVGAIGVLKRNTTGGKRLIRWAWLSIVALFLLLVASYVFDDDWDFAAMSGAEAAIAAVTACVMLLFALGPPVFVLWWMHRPRIKQEIAGWMKRHAG